MRRRDFLKGAAMTTGAIGGGHRPLIPDSALSHPSSAELKPSTPSLTIENSHFRVTVDLESGRYTITRANGQPFLLNASWRVFSPDGRVSSEDDEFARTAQLEKVRDALGDGQQLVVKCRSRVPKPDLEIRLTLYEGRSAVVIECYVRNASRKDILISHIEPLHTALEDGAGCCWVGAQKVLTNGYIYYDPGHLEDFFFRTRKMTQSMWNMAFYRGDDQEALVVGYLDNERSDGRISAYQDWTIQVLTPRWGEWAFGLVAESLLNRVCVLKPGDTVPSGRLILNLAPDPFSALESYAQATADLHQVHLNRIINGWCNWAYTHEYITEEEVIRNAEFIARHLKPYGMEFVQIDDGYQRAYGDWEGNERFPHGMKWLAEQINRLGLKAGIWVAPYVISDGTEIVSKHPDWLVHDLEGKVKQCGGNLDPQTADALGIPSFRPKLYGLDITHPEARQWLYHLFGTIAHDWNYEFVKIDFVEWTLLAADRYFDPGVSKAQAYRLGFETIRKAVGSQCHLLDCGPAPNTVGLIDSTRVERDLPHLTWEQYAKGFNSNAAAIKRYYFHKRTWINDDDHLGLGLLTIPQAQAAASLIALSGGTMISGDRLYELEPTRLEVLKKVVPSYGEAARPLDLFERECPEILAMKVRKDFASWLVVGIFNWDERATVRREIDFKRLDLKPQAQYIVYDFWAQKLLGLVNDQLQLTLEPSSVRLLAIREQRGVPQVISTDRHFTQGGLELEQVAWDEQRHALSGVSLGPQGTQHHIAIYVPASHRWSQEWPDYYHDYGDYSAILFEPNLLRLNLRFGEKEKVAWRVNFRRLSPEMQDRSPATP